MKPKTQDGDSSLESRYARGILLYRRGEYSQAVAELQPLQARKDMVGRIAKLYRGLSHRAMGVAALREGRFDSAEGHIREAMRDIGRHADLCSFLAALCAQTGRYEHCAAEMQRAAELKRDEPALLRRAAQAQWHAGRRTDALLTLLQAVRRFPDAAELHLQLGMFQAAEERYDDARRSLAAAAEIDCTSAEVHHMLGLAAAAGGDRRQAFASLQRAFELRPSDLMLAYQLALAARALAADGGNCAFVRLPEDLPAPEASRIRQIARYVIAEPDYVEAFLSLPPSGVDGELFALLCDIIRMALAEHPDYADMHWLCSRVLERLGNLSQAVAHAEKAVAVNPRYVQGLAQLGRLYAHAGRTLEAVAALERAIANGGDWADLHCLAGELLGQADRLPESRRHLERALQLNSEYTRAAEALAAFAA